MSNQERKKQILRKVRVNFIHKQPDGDEDDQQSCRPSYTEIAIVDPRTTFLPRREENVLYPTIGLAEEGRKLQCEIFVHNKYQRITHIHVQNNLMTRTVTLGIQINPNYFIKPWQYVVQRLESYGDLELAVWAKKIRHYEETYRQTMEKYFAIFTNGDPRILQELRRAKRRALIARQEIENNNTATLKSTLFANRSSVSLIAMTYTEDFLAEMEFTIESLAAWVKEKGLPSLVDKDCALNLAFCSEFFDSMCTDFERFNNMPETLSTIISADGKRKRVRIKAAAISEPTTEGVFVYFYYIIRPNTENLRALKSCKPVTEVMDKES